MIIDASVAFKWIVPEEDSGLADALVGADLFAPRLMLTEVGNALWELVRRGELAWSDTLMVDLGRLGGLVTLLDDAEVVTRALEIAREIDHPIYDCIYIACAEARDDQVVTADKRLIGKLAGHPLAGRVGMLAA